MAEQHNGPDAGHDDNPCVDDARVDAMTDDEVQLLGNIIDVMGSGQHPCAGYDDVAMTRRLVGGFALGYAVDCVNMAHPHLNDDGTATAARILDILDPKWRAEGDHAPTEGGA